MRTRLFVLSITAFILAIAVGGLSSNPHRAESEALKGISVGDVAKLFDAYQSAKIDERDATKEAREKMMAAEKEVRAVQNLGEEEKAKAEKALERAKADYDSICEEWRAKSIVARKKFLEAFEKSNWEEYDAKKDEQILVDGLAGVAFDNELTNPELSIRALKFLLMTLPKHRASLVATAYSLPRLFFATKDIGELASEIESLKKSAGSQAVPFLDLILADIDAAKGKSTEALKRYQDIQKTIPKDMKGPDIRRELRGRLTTRLELINKSAPEIDLKGSLGGELSSLSALKGRAVVLAFMSTRSAPCRWEIPTLHDLSQDSNTKEATFIALVEREDRGFVPESMSALRNREDKKGEWVTGLDREGFEKHIQSFREKLGLQFPFSVIQSAVQEEFKAAQTPFFVVVDKEGKIVFVQEGAGKGKLLKAAIASQLK